MYTLKLNNYSTGRRTDNSMSVNFAVGLWAVMVTVPSSCGLSYDSAIELWAVMVTAL